MRLQEVMNVAEIELHDLTKHFGRGDRKVRAVDGIDLTVEGGIHGFIGPNGAGKSTTLKMIVGAINPTSGKGSIRGHPLGSVGARRCLGYLPEHPRFYDQPLYDYLVYMGRLGGMSRSAAQARVLELVDWLELGEAMNRNVNNFSAGMKQKAGFAQALIHEPPLLILDEPTANLDPLGRAGVLEKVKMLSKEKGITIFLSSHILAEVEKVVEQVSVINRGQILLSTEVSEAKRRFGGDHFYLRTSRPDEVLDHARFKSLVRRAWEQQGDVLILTEREAELKAALPAILTECEATLELFSPREVSLEDLFLRLVKEGKAGAGAMGAPGARKGKGGAA